jgi:hypothetical protein
LVKRRNLGLEPKPANPHLPGLDFRHHADPAGGSGSYESLVPSKLNQLGIGHRVNQPETEEWCGNPSRGDIGDGGNGLGVKGERATRSDRPDAVILKQRPAQVCQWVKDTVVQPSKTGFQAPGGTANGIGVTGGARCLIEDRSKTFVRILDFRERISTGIETGKLSRRKACERFAHCRPTRSKQIDGLSVGCLGYRLAGG